MSRSHRTAALVAVLAMVGVMSACGSTRPPADKLAELRAIGQPLDVPLPASVREAKLVDSRGITHTLDSLRGKTVVLGDTMTLCQETCPLDTSALVETAREADAAGLSKKVVFLSLTVDPVRDTPAQLAAYRRQFSRVPANWLLLTGESASVHHVLKSLGVFWRRVGEDGTVVRNWRTGERLTYDIQHSDEVFFIDSSGHERFLLDGPPQLGTSAEVPPALRHFLNGEGRKNLDDPDPTEWTVPQALKVLTSMDGNAA